MKKILLALCVSALPFVATAKPISPEALSQTITHYYQNPTDDKVGNVIDFINSDMLQKIPQVENPLTGFLAGLFSAQPEKIDTWLASTEDYTPKAVSVLSYALWLSQNPKKSEQFLKDHGFDPEKMDAFKNVSPGLKRIGLNSPDALDMYWGAFSATGDITFVKRIFEQGTDLVKNEDVPASDIFQFIYNFNKQNDTLREIGLKYSEKPYFKNFILSSTALWSVTGNIQTHPKVATFIKEKIDDTKDEKLLSLLKPLAFIGRHDLIASTDEEHQIMLFSTKNANYTEKPLKELIQLNEVDNVFTKEDPITFVGIIPLLTGEAGELSFTLTTPTGERKKFDTIILKPVTEKASLQSLSAHIEKGNLTLPGTYTVTLSGHAGGREITLKNAFYIL